MSNENTKKKPYTAVNAFIFAGSFSIGVMNAGFKLDEVLEISDDILKKNAFYFKKNYPSIPVRLPKEWENDEYLAALNKKGVDAMFCNCPCSSLSRINLNASVDGPNNIHFYRLFDVFSKVKPKTFVIENAPTLIQLGFPILKDMVAKLGNEYRFTILRDMAGNHKVPMKRMRTMVVGWRRDLFKETPLLKMDKHPKMTVKDTLQDIYDDTTDDACPKDILPIRSLLKFSLPHHGIFASLAIKLNEGDPAIVKEIMDGLPTKVWKGAIQRYADKIKNKKGYWDKSARRMNEDDQFPSMSGPQEYMHPIQDRCLNVRELKRIMGYPESFDFTDPNKECITPMQVCMAQGVPVNFGNYIANQVINGLDGKLKTFSADIIFQNNLSEQYYTYSIDDFNKLELFDIKLPGEPIKE
jgi:site-specific DNA-cytosine methylase